MSNVCTCRFAPANGSLKDEFTDDVSHSLLVCVRLSTHYVLSPDEYVRKINFIHNLR